MNQPYSSDPCTHTAERPDLLTSNPWRAECEVVETTLLLPTELFLALESAARRRQMSISRLMRELIRLHLTPPAEQSQGGHDCGVADRRTSPEAAPTFVSAQTSTPDDPMASDDRYGTGEPELGVLVVDDSTAIRNLLADMFRSDGFTVWQAADGREAEAVFRTHQSRVGLILMDVQMPEESGPQALTAIRQFAPLVPCWFMTGNPGEHTEGSLLACGAERVLSKPFRLDEVRTLVSVLFSPRRTTAGARGATNGMRTSGSNGTGGSHAPATSPEEV